jgi:hypothetical protein
MRTRLFVVQPTMRQKLLLFGTSTSGGLEPADLQQLRDSISTLPPAPQERTLLPLPQTTVASADGNLLAAERWRRTLHSLGSTAPADQLLPQQSTTDVTEYLRHSLTCRIMVRRLLPGGHHLAIGRAKQCGAAAAGLSAGINGSNYVHAFRALQIV